MAHQIWFCAKVVQWHVGQPAVFRDPDAVLAACRVPIVGPTTDSGSAFVFIDEAAGDRSADYPCVLGVIDRLVGSWRSQMLAAVGRCVL
jgi:hypothetical protein